jgi:hypothetical protein
VARRLSPLERALRAKTEDEWRGDVLEYAAALGWTVAYFRPARTEGGWRTPVGADGKGWPDLTLVRDRIVFAELKRETAELEPEQIGWRDRLISAGAEWYLWRPRDADEVLAVLRRRGSYWP